MRYFRWCFPRSRWVSPNEGVVTRLIGAAFNAMPFVCSVPIVVGSADQIGTGYGLYKAVSGRVKVGSAHNVVGGSSTMQGL